MILAQYLPERSAQDILAGRVRLTLGGQAFDLPALTIAQCDAFRARASAELGQLFGSFEAIESPMQMVAWLGGTTDLQLAILRSFDLGGVLPDDAWVREHATPEAVLRAVFEVTACAFPPFAVALDLIVRNPAAITTLLEAGTAGSSRPTSARRPTTAGAPESSGTP